MNLYLKQYEIKGIVQGVGFRPFVAKIARENNINGWIVNDSNGVTLELEATEDNINLLLNEIKKNHPPLAIINEINLLKVSESRNLHKKFLIKKSRASRNRQALIATDSDVCDDCLQELFSPKNRRYKYPFINCTNCGPRFSIIEDLPYDRKKTTMKSFEMCKACRLEYLDLSDRRFHAQPNACWNCGPKIELLNDGGKKILTMDPILDVIKFLKDGRIIAVKGIGGYHLVVDPSNEAAVRELRKRKGRKEKPFAILVESVETAKQIAHINKVERELLLSNRKPIVLLKRKSNDLISQPVAPRNDNYGVMLPCTPIQHLLITNNFSALIFTSANISDQPIEYRNEEAVNKLGSIADYFLNHNRDIKTRVDDSVVRHEENHGISIIRRSRGYAPGFISLFEDFPTGLAMGAELKNTICLNRKEKFFLSQHIGDLKNLEVYDSFRESIEHFKKILEVVPEYASCDLNPNFYSTRYAMEQKGIPVFQIQHHHAHMASCMAENNIPNKVIGIIFDGMGYGVDGNLWGGEFLIGDYNGFERYAHIKYFPLLGGDRAVKEPFRIAIALLHEAFKDKILDVYQMDIISKRKEEVGILLKMAENNINAPLTSSVGRLFDGISALIGLREIIEYEGQAAIELEQQIKCKMFQNNIYAYEIIKKEGETIIDVLPLVREIVGDLNRNVSKSLISKKFHDTLVSVCVDICDSIKKQSGLDEVVLSGGVFQNQYLLKNIRERLESNLFKVYTHSQVPSNDGGISLGQAVVGAFKYKKHISL